MASLRGHKIETNLQSTSRGGGGHKRKKRITLETLMFPPTLPLEVLNSKMATIGIY